MKVKIIKNELDGKGVVETEIELYDEDLAETCRHIVQTEDTLDMGLVMDDIQFGVVPYYFLEDYGLRRFFWDEDIADGKTYGWDFVDRNAFYKELKAFAQKWLDNYNQEYVKDPENTLGYHINDDVEYSHRDGNYVYYKVKVELFTLVDE